LFGLESSSPLANNLTAEQAISLGGGVYEKLARHGIAALLNASEGSVFFPFSTDTVISMVQQGMVDDATPGEPEATQLADVNSLVCPLP
jgi:hypothetical protein